ncbi:hypothetical protein CABS01_16004 [Colletotrichum abscissum]|uniref:uncharacterized protein n=1 Tax=Colletotrichum abscissum TaxID=1671311 RepID=UPI0027D64A31|nr:uncharacterized protein CABS01_16004 [Colletotrichum abscissum]KAK1474025.1 hypothetical protein CABS01_16004 [Colletotrichum abscissum]
MAFSASFAPAGSLDNIGRNAGSVQRMKGPWTVCARVPTISSFSGTPAGCMSWPRMVAEYCKSTCRVWWVHAVGDELRMWFRYLNRRDSLEIERMTWYKHVKTGSCRASQIVIDNSIPMVVNRDLRRLYREYGEEKLCREVLPVPVPQKGLMGSIPYSLPRSPINAAGRLSSYSR